MNWKSSTVRPFQGWCRPRRPSDQLVWPSELTSAVSIVHDPDNRKCCRLVTNVAAARWLWVSLYLHNELRSNIDILPSHLKWDSRWDVCVAFFPSGRLATGGKYSVCLIHWVLMCIRRFISSSALLCLCLSRRQPGERDRKHVFYLSLELLTGSISNSYFFHPQEHSLTLFLNSVPPATGPVFWCLKIWPLVRSHVRDFGCWSQVRCYLSALCPEAPAESTL